MIYQDCSRFDFQAEGFEKAAKLLHAHAQGMSPSSRFTVIFPSKQELTLTLDPAMTEKEVAARLLEKTDEAVREVGLEIGEPEVMPEPEPKPVKKSSAKRTAKSKSS